MLIGRFSEIPETTGTTVVDKICTTGGIERGHEMWVWSDMSMCTQR